jgi:hypothetical protein
MVWASELGRNTFVRITYTRIYVCMYIHTYVLHTYIYIYHTYIRIYMRIKNTLFKGFTRGDPWAPSLVKQD